MELIIYIVMRCLLKLNIMTKLEKLKEVVKQYREAGCSSYKGMVEATEEVFGYNHPYIHKDDCGEASHIFFENQVFFFGGDLYSS